MKTFAFEFVTPEKKLRTAYIEAFSKSEAFYQFMRTHRFKTILSCIEVDFAE